MIKRLDLHNFKCFSDQTFDFSNISVFAGANAVGKSSVIQALLLADETIIRGRDGTISAIPKIAENIGSVKGFVSQNPVQTRDADFEIIIEDDISETKYSYCLDRSNIVNLKTCILPPRTNDYNISYLRAERIGARVRYVAGNDKGIEPDGANAPFLIDQADVMGLKVHKDVAIEGVEATFSRQLEAWMSFIIGEMRISVSTESLKADSSIFYRNSIVDEGVLPPMTGFGISYILPILVGGLYCSSIDNSILIVENPEAHLHPSAQSKIGEFLNILTRSGVQVIIETHSEHVIDGIRRHAVEAGLTDGVIIYFLENSGYNGIVADKIKLNEFGELDRWPKGFFDQKTDDLRKLFEARRNACR